MFHQKYLRLRRKNSMQASIPIAADFYHKEYLDFLKLINHPFALHRKMWEWLYIITKLRDSGVLAEGARGLCFGSGKEPLLIFAHFGCKFTATDAPLAISSGLWIDLNQHAQGLADLQRPDIIDNKTFTERVTFQSCDMNAISKNLTSFNFCWSSSSLDHLGNLRKGIDFIINSVEETLRIGGVACHTTELNLSSDTETIETETLSVCRRCDLENLAAEVQARGHVIAPPSVCTSGETAAAGTPPDGPAFADPQAWAQGRPRSPAKSRRPRQQRLCAC